MNFNMKNIFGSMNFGIVSNVYISNFGIAVKNEEGIIVSYDKENNEIVNVDQFCFEAEGIAYALPVPAKQIKTGDTISHNKKIMFVENLENGEIHAIDINRGEKKVIMPAKSMFGFNYITKIISMFDFSSGNNTASENNPFGNMLLPILMSNSKSVNGNHMNDVIKMMTIMNMSGDNDIDINNPLMLALLMDGGSDDNNFFQTMAMMNLINQNQK